MRGSLESSQASATTAKTWENMLEEFENDESPSAPLDVTLPRLSEGQSNPFTSLTTMYTMLETLNRIQHC